MSYYAEGHPSCGTVVFAEGRDPRDEGEAWARAVSFRERHADNRSFGLGYELFRGRMDYNCLVELVVVAQIQLVPTEGHFED